MTTYKREKDLLSSLRTPLYRGIGIETPRWSPKDDISLSLSVFLSQSVTTAAKFVSLYTSLLSRTSLFIDIRLLRVHNPNRGCRIHSP